MSSNKKIRRKLEKIYGRGCMFKRARIEEKIEKLGGIKTYKKFLEEKKFTLKEIRKYEKKMTLHHLKHRREGGRTTIENGVEINALAHCYCHDLPREQEEIINNMLREYKNSANCKIEFVDDMDFDFSVKTTTFSINEKEKNKEDFER